MRRSKRKSYVSKALAEQESSFERCLIPGCRAIAGRSSAFCDAHFLCARHEHRIALSTAPAPIIDEQGRWRWFQRADRLRWFIAARDVFNDVTGEEATPAASLYGRDPRVWPSGLFAPDTLSGPPRLAPSTPHDKRK